VWRIGRPQWHDEPATHLELLNQRRRDMPKRGCHDHGVERTAFRPPLIAVTDLNTHRRSRGLSAQARRIGVPGLARRRNGASDTRARAMGAALSKLFSWLVEHRKIAINPAVGM
jgi:hypothetical protein